MECINSGGVVTTSLCCKSAGAFPNTCVIGACGCSPENSHEVDFCECGGGKCFDGQKCVAVGGAEISSFEECVEAGYPVMESYPRRCMTPDGRSFTESLNPSMEYLCEEARGHWNECSNRCMLDNQGKERVACPMMCEALCECGGIAGYRCPDGYYCQLPEGVADALGYCVEGVSDYVPERPPEEQATFCTAPTGETMHINEALIAAGSGKCTDFGILTEDYLCNDYTGMWWLGLAPYEPKAGCNPACVVNVATGQAEVNWRCTGALPE
ncbi:MAG: hypothetical protein ACP5E4_01135 [Candidatus Aenigmatarchaeota archaeon]